MSALQPPDFQSHLLEGKAWIDVRAPIEFNEGAIPGAVNLPLLNDSERAEIGTIYKQSGQAAALQRGHQLVSGDLRRQRTQQWAQFLTEHPGAVVYCFRGGLRSQIVQTWLKEEGVACQIVSGGYKALRRFLLESLEEQIHRHEALGGLAVISGPTGVGKTELLNQFRHQAVDLEHSAQHRGSAFGGRAGGQPNQVDFENDVSLQFLRLADQPQLTLLEDESRMIGQRIVPPFLYQKMEMAPVVRIDAPLAERVQRIHDEYVATPLAGAKDRSAVIATLMESVLRIRQKLGGVRTEEVLSDLARLKIAAIENQDLTNHQDWIRKLLEWYYDPVYERGFQRRQARVLFRGSKLQAAEFLRGYKADI